MAPMLCISKQNNITCSALGVVVVYWVHRLLTRVQKTSSSLNAAFSTNGS